MTNAEYGEGLAASAPPLSDEQVSAAARIYACDTDAVTQAAG